MPKSSKHYTPFFQLDPFRPKHHTMSEYCTELAVVESTSEAKFRMLLISLMDFINVWSISSIIVSFNLHRDL